MSYTPATYYTHQTTHVYHGLEFDITLNFEEEDLPLEDAFEDTPEVYKDYYHKINTGQLVYFYAVMTASYHGIELAHDSLGACLYTSYDEFINEDDYYGDMLQTVCREAFEKLKEIVKSIQEQRINIIQ